MGNICRSPTAEAVFRQLLQQNGLAGYIEVASAGVDAYHVGDSPDNRAQRTAWRRGYDLSRIRARKITLEDFERFDLILAMDKRVLRLLQSLCPSDHTNKLVPYMTYARHSDTDEVPDPYYGLGHGFDLVLDMVEDASLGLIEEIKKKLRRT